MPLQIAGLTINNPFILAPLAGYTDLPFRLLCREYGAGLVFSEMISCHGLLYNQQKTWDMTLSDQRERPVAMQLFGSDPDVMGRAASMLCRLPIDCIDINMGCPVKKVTQKGAGAALMKTPLLAAAIIRQVCAHAGDKPVTVKFRSGWSHDSINAPEFAQMAEESGASAVTIHARTWSDGFSGSADWEVLARSKEKISIPLIGNGDILTHEQGVTMMKMTGCDGVMIGRGCLGRPWIFAGTYYEETPLLRLKAVKRHMDLINEFIPPQWTLGKIRNHAGKYFKGMRNGTLLRNRIYQTETFAALRKLIDDLLEEFTDEKTRKSEITED